MTETVQADLPISVPHAVIGRGRELAVLAKRTYSIAPDGVCRPIPEQPPLNDDFVEDTVDGQEYLVADSELIAFKPGVDVVVKAKAYGPGNRPVNTLEAGIDIGSRSYRVRVYGDRHVILNGDRIRFSSPEPFTTMDISYRNAYGGVDRWARHELDAQTINPLLPYLAQDLSGTTFAAYPRNKVGKGYVINYTPEIDGMPLPNIEDPNDLLTPERLICDGPYKWRFQPLPAGMDWFHYTWFPRSAFLGFCFEERPDYPSPDEPPVREIQLGYLPEDGFGPKQLLQAVDDRFMNGASPWLILPSLKGDEPIALYHLDPEYPVFRFKLPGQLPKMWVRPLTEKEKTLKPRLITVVIEKEKNLVSLIWSGVTSCNLVHTPDHLEKVNYGVLWEA